MRILHLFELKNSKLDTILYQRGQTNTPGLAQGWLGRSVPSRWTPEQLWPSALAARQRLQLTVIDWGASLQACHVEHAQFREGFRLLSSFLAYWKSFSMHNQTFHLKAAVFSPAVTKATQEASATGKAIQKLRASLRSEKSHGPGFPGNLRHASLGVPSLLHLTPRMNEDSNHSIVIRTKQRAFPRGT